MIFQIGFNRCGTHAIADFLRQSVGGEVLHWQNGHIARKISLCLQNQRRIEFNDGVTACLDMELIDPAQGRFIEGYRAYRELHLSYPGSLFVLNTRPVESWIDSRLRHNDGAYLAKWAWILGKHDCHEICDLWRQLWHDHLRAVLEYAGCNKDFSLLTFNIETDRVSKFYRAFNGARIEYNDYLPGNSLLPVKYASTNRVETAIRRSVPILESIGDPRNSPGYGVQMGLYRKMFDQIDQIDRVDKSLLQAREYLSKEQLKYNARIRACL